MQTVCSSSISGLKGLTLSRKPSTRSTVGRTALRVVSAAQQSHVGKAKAAVATLPILLGSHPALALVDDRLGGEGTGKILGVGGIEGWAILLVFGLVWSLFFAAQTQLGDGPKGRGKGDDSGLSL